MLQLKFLQMYTIPHYPYMVLQSGVLPAKPSTPLCIYCKKKIVHLTPTQLYLAI